MLNKIISRLTPPSLQGFFEKPIPRNIQAENEVLSSIIDLSNGEYLKEEYIGTKNTRLRDIANQVKDQGFVIIPNVFSQGLIKQFRKEFDSIIRNGEACKYVVDRHDGATCVRVEPRKSLETDRFPLTTAFFDMDIFKKVSECFYETKISHIGFNTEIFVHETPETTSPLSMPLHWDRAQTLKFWIYIDDIPLESGPMRVVRESSKTNKLLRLQKSSANTELIGGVDNLTGIDEDLIINLTGSAGSILIHDTDASHGATPVKNGHTRRIMRGHTRLKRKYL